MPGKVKIEIDGPKMTTTVEGIKGHSCTDVTKLFDGLLARHGGTVAEHNHTDEFVEEELVVEDVHR